MDWPTFLSGRRALSIVALSITLTPAVLDAQQVHAVRVSVSSSGQEASTGGWWLGNSADGRHILFSSNASNLVEGDTNGSGDLFVRDRDTDRDGVFDEPGAVATVRVSIGTHGEQSGASTATGTLSRDGRFVLFNSDASTLVPGDTNDSTDVFLHDRDTDADGVFDEPGAISTTRISEGPGGEQGDRHSTGLVMSPDARFFLFVSESSTFSAQPVNRTQQIYRKDRTTGALTLVTRSVDGLPADDYSSSPSMSNDGRIVAFQSSAGNLGGGVRGVSRAYVRDLEADRLVYYMEPRPAAGPGVFQSVGATPGVAPDGSTVYFNVEEATSTASLAISVVGWLHEYDVRTGTLRIVAEGIRFAFADDPRYLTFTAALEETKSACRYNTGFYRFDRVTRSVTTFMPGAIDLTSASSAAGRAVFVQPKSNNCPPSLGLGPEAVSYLFDLQYGTRLVLPAAFVSSSMNSDGSELIVNTRDATLLPPGVDNNAEFDVYVIKLDSMLDRDADQLDDRWETAMGLSITSGAGNDGPSGDPDGDGISNLDEQAAYSHPRGTAVRYLAEGAENAFFSTTLAFANPGDIAATAVVRILGEQGATSAVFVAVPAHGQRTFAMRDAPLPALSFSMVVESNVPLAIERTMSWTPGNSYGGHAEHAVADLSASWYLAEGSTTGDFSLFYLLQNPHDTPVRTTIRYLRPAGLAPVERTYVLPPNSRTTIPVKDEAPELASTDVSADIRADDTILVERAMYLSRGGQPFAAGHASVGVTAPSVHWYFGEGATGDYFDLFLLVANPSAQDAAVEARYLLSDGRVFTKTYDVRANSRLTIWVDGEEIPGQGRVLANVDVSTVLTSTNGVPIVAERAMWFPGPAFTPLFWTEAHVSAGVTQTATRWVVADAYEGGPNDVQSFVLIANTSDVEGSIRVQYLHDGGSPYYLYQGVIPANSRLTLPMRNLYTGFGTTDSDAIVGRPAGVLVESLGTGTVAQLVVERSTYWNAGGVTWAAGVNVLATPVP
jgi:hypothetical protein